MADDATLEGFLSPAAIKQKLALADIGAELVQRATAATERASRPGFVDEYGIKPAVATSAAETYWVYCAIHGHMHSLDAFGKLARVGVCEACFRHDHSPETLRRRRREVSVAAAQEAEAARLSALVAKERAEQLAAELEIDAIRDESAAATAGAVVPLPDEALGELPERLRPSRDTKPRLVPLLEDTGPLQLPTAGESDLSSQWLRLTEMD